jgi:hypothetical protein
LKKIAQFISLVLHPVFIPFVCGMIIIHLCPTLFNEVPAKDLKLWQIQLGLNTILYPLVFVFLMWRLGFIKNVYMRTNQERLAPLMASILFYFWNYYVFHKQHTAVPIIFKSFLLGTFISVSILFATTIFTKMSMHTTGIAGAATALILLHFIVPCSILAIVIAAIIAVVLVIASRLYLKEHTVAEIISGLIIGAGTQLLAYWFYTNY